MTLNVVVSGSRAEVLEYVYRQGLRDDLQVPADAARGLDDVTAGSEQCVVRLQVDLLEAGDALRRMAEPARGTDAAMEELAERHDQREAHHQAGRGGHPVSAPVDMSELPVTLSFVPVEAVSGEQIEELAREFPRCVGVKAVPQVGHVIAMPGGPWKVRKLVWNFPTTQTAADKHGGQLVFVHIYREDGDDE